MTTRTPLRYPGGKSRLTGFVKLVMDQNGLSGGEYMEPYAGGAGVALNLLSSDHAAHVHINDINEAIFAFWKCVFDDPDNLCQLIHDTPVTMDTWHQQKAVFENQTGKSTLELGFAAFFLNRTNRSGILTGGVIGGKKQLGKWKIDARYHKENLCLKIETLSTFADRVSLYNLDAELLLNRIGKALPKKSLTFLDPPYFVKSKRLYEDLYTPKDHARIAERVKKLKRPWIISYDKVPQISRLYFDLRGLSYDLPYSAGRKHNGAEVIFVSSYLQDTGISDPLTVSAYR
jgi:DNA adenine methylase